MQITFKGKNTEMSAALEEYAEKRLERIAKYFDSVINVVITFKTERAWHIVDVNVNAGSIKLRGEEKTNDMYSSIDMVIDKLETQIKKQKGKAIKRHKIKTIRHPENMGIITDEVQEKTKDEVLPVIPSIKIKKLDTSKPMLVAEAIK